VTLGHVCHILFRILYFVYDITAGLNFIMYSNVWMNNELLIVFTCCVYNNKTKYANENIIEELDNCPIAKFVLIYKTRKDVVAECRHDIRPSAVTAVPSGERVCSLLVAAMMANWRYWLLWRFDVFWRPLTLICDLFKWKLALYLLVPCMGNICTNYDFFLCFCFLAFSGLPISTLSENLDGLDIVWGVNLCYVI